jgi:orotidine-5'-phosphate decarboxylase
MEKTPRDYLVLALDNCASLRQIQRLVEETSPYFGMCKVGLEQFVRFGPSIIDIIRSSDRKIFLDLKLHDIPNTVAQAVAAAAEHEVDLITLHTSGGLAMLSAAAETAATLVYPPKLIGVTVLTSIDQLSFNRELRYGGSVAEHVAHLGKMAVNAGLDGIVCSAADLPTVKPVLPADYEIITPGIRLGEGITHDQKRVTSPSEALSAGATRLVIGRAVTEAENPAEVAARILEAVKTWMTTGK